MVRSKFVYYVPRTLNVPVYHTSVPYQRTVPFQKRRTVPAYRTSEQKLWRTVGLSYRTVVAGQKERAPIAVNWLGCTTFKQA